MSAPEINLATFRDADPAQLATEFNISPTYPSYLSVEATAQTICTFRPDIVYGLVQAEEFTDEQPEHTYPLETPPAAETSINKLRHSRVAELLGRGTEIYVVLSEDCLEDAARVLSPQARQAQFRHLTEGIIDQETEDPENALLHLRVWRQPSEMFRLNHGITLVNGSFGASSPNENLPMPYEDPEAAYLEHDINVTSQLITRAERPDDLRTIGRAFGERVVPHMLDLEASREVIERVNASRQ